MNLVLQDTAQRTISLEELVKGVAIDVVGLPVVDYLEQASLAVSQQDDLLSTSAPGISAPMLL